MISWDGGLNGERFYKQIYLSLKNTLNPRHQNFLKYYVVFPALK